MPFRFFTVFGIFFIAPMFASCIQYPPPLPEQEQEYILPDVKKIKIDQTVGFQGDATADGEIQSTAKVNPLILDPDNPYFCSNKRLDTAIRYLKNGKEYMKSYYGNRNLSYLFFAWYASEDSVYLANTVKLCDYKRSMHYYAVRKIQRLNVYLQKDVIRNMREGEYKELGELYMDEYREIFPRDIR